MSPYVEQRPDARVRIVRAACEVFGDCGYQGATYQAIAVLADVTRPAVSYHFPDKRVLYRHAVDYASDVVIRPGIESARNKPTLVGQLSAFVTGALVDNPPQRSCVAFLVSSMVDSQRHAALSQTDLDLTCNVRTVLNAAVGSAIKRGELLPDTDAASTTDMLLTLLWGVSFYSGFVGGTDAAQQIVEHIAG